MSFLECIQFFRPIVDLKNRGIATLSSIVLYCIVLYCLFVYMFIYILLFIYRKQTMDGQLYCENHSPQATPEQEKVNNISGVFIDI